MRFQAPLPALLAVLALVSRDMTAQVVRGRVVDRAQGTPIPSASVSLSDTGNAVVATVLTDDRGAFELRAPGPGAYTLALRRIGYQGRELELDVLATAVVRIPDEVSSLEALPVELEEATITGTRHPRLERAGFYERRQEGHGSFITREEFEVMRPSETTDVLRRLRGIRVTSNPNYGVSPTGEADTRRYIIGSSRGTQCPTLYFLDGIYIGSAGDKDIDLDMTIRVHDIEAIEVYSGAGQLPERFNIMGAMCGALVLWTR